ncbi:MAG: VWA domain-containing protein [Vicinamibacterales bacterium]
MPSLGFLAPAFLLGALAAAVPVVLHLLQKRPDAVLGFSAVRLLRSAPSRGSRRRRLRNLVVLALRVAALLLLAVSFARPFLSSGAAASSRRPITVVVLDVSASMSSPGVAERARAAVRRATTTAPGGDLVALVTFADGAAVISPPTGDRGAVVAIADGIRPGAGGTNYAAALSRASELVAEGPGRVVIVTDMQRPGGKMGEAAARLAAGTRIDIVDVGSNAGNLAVVGVERRRHDHVVAVVRNTGREPRKADVTLSIDGRVAAREQAMVEEDGRVEVDFALPLPERGSAAVGVEDGTGAVLDDKRYMVLDPPAAPRLLVVGDGSRGGEAFFVVRALGVGKGRFFEVSNLPPPEIDRVADSPAGDSYAVAVLLSTRGMTAAGRSYLRRQLERGGGVLVAAGPVLDVAVLAELTGGRLRLEPGSNSPRPPRSLLLTERRHPAFRALTDEGQFRNVRVTRACVLDVGGGAQTLARFNDGSAALAQAQVASGRGTVVAIASDLGGAWNDLPRSPAFLPLLHSVVRNLGAGRELPGELSGCNLPPGSPATPGVVDMSELTEGDPGAWSRPEGYRVALNVEPAESETARATEEELRAWADVTQSPVETRTAGAETRERDFLWRYALAAFLLVLVAESLVARRAV